MAPLLISLPQQLSSPIPENYRKTPSELEILVRSGLTSTDANGILTGVDMPALAFAASHALGLTEIPAVSLFKKGGFNKLFCLEFSLAKRKVLARIPHKLDQPSPRVDSSVATSCFAHYVRDIPTPQIFAWNANQDPKNNLVRVPYILLECLEDVVEAWKGWPTSQATDRFEEAHVLLRELALLYSKLLEPLPASLQGVGDLVFAPRIDADSDLSDPKNYALRPLKLHTASETAFSASTTSLDTLWDELWLHYRQLYLPEPGVEINLMAFLALTSVPGDAREDAGAFMAAAKDARAFAQAAMRKLAQHPTYAEPVLFPSDFAFRNILIDRETRRVRAIVDWDDVYVMPFVIGVAYPKDILEFCLLGLTPDAQYFKDGCFEEFPPDEYGDITEDKDGTLVYLDENLESPGIAERNERIFHTACRETFAGVLRRCDARVGDPEMWELRRAVLKAYRLMMSGGFEWWGKRVWLAEQTKERAS
ncbi:hypothetical protein H0H81_007982 [Sphagnurus paluster]|uniref:Aminoglycoside phosphotransferase domain-containing protein n=1 Tax=Sphagnurus paluster TaxID=117069 RepID=A0A9P7GJ75_9AGAR|nr:hypothetical protein H0H81_007982 [Sphagnurus paluster]